MTQNQWYAILSCTDLKKKTKRKYLKAPEFFSNLQQFTTGKTTILRADRPWGLCITDFIPAGEQRLLQYSDYRAEEINWTN